MAPVMNYFAHGRDLLDAPYRLAGAAVPDWLGACDRRARLRRDRLNGATGDLADGIRHHLAEDAWFHGTGAFLEASGVITRWIRDRNPDDPTLRAAFFGHIMAEMLLDAVLIEEEPARLDRYYRALGEVDADRVAGQVEAWVSRPPRRLAEFIDVFREGRWLYGYTDDDGFAKRVGGVAGRVGVRLPRDLGGVLPEARALIRARRDDLLAAP